MSDNERNQPRLGDKIQAWGLAGLMGSIGAIGANVFISSAIKIPEGITNAFIDLGIVGAVGSGALLGAGVLVEVGERAEQRRHESAASS